MQKKISNVIFFISVVVIFVYLANPTKAGDSQLYVACGGDNQTTIGCIGDSQTFFMGLSALNLTLIKPSNGTYISGSFIPLDYSAPGASSVWYNLDNGANTTLISNSTFNTTSGLHTLYLYANNTNGFISRNTTFTVNSTKFTVIYSNYAGTYSGNSIEFNDSTYEELQNLSGVILENTGYGKIQFNVPINLTNISSNVLNLDNYTNISSNYLEINSSILPNLNTSATLYLYNLTFTNPQILMDGVVCPDSVCTEINYSGGTLVFNVTHFTTYSAQETPVTPSSASTPAGGGGGFAGSIPQCTQDNQCSNGNVCYNNFCVKLFDIKILNFESPVPLGSFFTFTYYLKGMANISSDVVVKFWIGQNGNISTSGSDTLYLGNFTEKTETTKIFLPSDLKSGIYEFYVEVDYGRYSAQSSRTIQIEVNNGVASISFFETNKILIIALIVSAFIIVLLALIIIFRRRNNPRRIKTFLPKKGFSLKDIPRRMNIALLRRRYKREMMRYEREQRKKQERAEVSVVKKTVEPRRYNSSEELINEILEEKRQKEISERLNRQKQESGEEYLELKPKNFFSRLHESLSRFFENIKQKARLKKVSRIKPKNCLNKMNQKLRQKTKMKKHLMSL